jgi:hypothetical protein
MRRSFLLTTALSTVRAIAGCQGDSDDATGDALESTEPSASASGDAGPMASGLERSLQEFQPGPLPDVSELGLPAASDGTLVVMEMGPVAVHYDPTLASTPLTTRVSCNHWLKQCYELRGKDMDACFAAVPRCKTDTPWMSNDICCPDACYRAYLNARGSTDQLSAWLAVFAGDATCIPGYARWIAGEMP